MTLAGSADLPGKAARVSLDTPSILGTKLDTIRSADTADYKVADALAAALHGSAEKLTKGGWPRRRIFRLASVTRCTAAIDRPG